MANSPCPETIPFYYPLTLHIIAGVSIPVNLVGFYLVWYQSPKMQGYKYCLCYLQNGASQMYFKKFLLILCHLFPFAASFSMWMSRLTYQQKYDFVKDNWSQCLFWMRFEAFEVYDYKLNPWLAVVGIGALLFVLIVYTYGLSLGIHTMSILQKFRKSMSKQTFQMHKTALFSLVMQLLIPGVLIIIPLGVCMTVVITGAVGLQELATNTMFLVSSHSMCSCFVMISSNPRYRTVVKEKFEKKEWDETFKFSGTESTKNK
uniref:Serpentine Receptor, class I n=1 Tax=Caenorhabditis tropicalis TaxID=1561998 RepID=A0A1I7UGZ2_9PELO